MKAAVWFRRDLRLADNPAWAAATSRHDEVRALFVIDPRLWRGAGTHRLTQLGAHLRALDDELRRTHGGRLQVHRGSPVEVIPAVGDRLDAVCWNDDYSPYAVVRDRQVAAALHRSVERFSGTVVHSPGSLRTKAGGGFTVFTPYYRRWSAAEWETWPEPGGARVGADPGEGVPEVSGSPLMAGGERAARDRLEEFLEHIDGYGEGRDRSDLDVASRLSADLKFGTLSPRRVVAEAGSGSPGRDAFVRQLCWRDFWAQLLWHHPDTIDAPMRTEYASMEWLDDEAGLAAWQEGRTGYPIVDAGMRQLRAEGWMHNRVRMITASFLVKDLLIDWRRGERYFRRMLVDGDIAQNVGNWQWVAGTGADAAPYFRVFNPVAQSRRFDPEGVYIRRYVPELRPLPAPQVHAPWEAGPLELAGTGFVLGKTYPPPMVDHGAARERALATYERARAR